MPPTQVTQLYVASEHTFTGISIKDKQLWSWSVLSL